MIPIVVTKGELLVLAHTTLLYCCQAACMSASTNFPRDRLYDFILLSYGFILIMTLYCCSLMYVVLYYKYYFGKHCFSTPGKAHLLERNNILSVIICSINSTAVPFFIWYTLQLPKSPFFPMHSFSHKKAISKMF